MPIWAAFMKRATRGDKPDWFERPANVIGAQRLPHVRASCRRAAATACRWSTATGSSRSARWSTPSTSSAARSPTEICPLHSPSFTDRLAGVFGKEVGVPVSAARCRSAAGDREHVGSSPSGPWRRPSRHARRKVEEPKKKRGFWGRIFGREKTTSARRKKNGRKKKSGEKAGHAPPGGQPNDQHSCRFVTSSATGICSISWPARVGAGIAAAEPDFRGP